MNEMIYGDTEALKNGHKIIESGTFEGIDYKIVNIRGSHPCAYIRPTQDIITKYQESGDAEYDEYDGWRIDVHGGVTFYGIYDDEAFGNDEWIGWDYAHLCDYTCIVDCEGNIYNPDVQDYEHKWTIEELYEEVKEAIKELKENYK